MLSKYYVCVCVFVKVGSTKQRKCKEEIREKRKLKRNTRKNEMEKT